MEQELQTLWRKVLSDIEPEVSKANYLTLFKTTSLLSLENNTATIAAASTMLISLLKRFSENIKKYLDKHTGANTTIIFVPKIIQKESTNEKTGPLFTQEIKPVIGHLPRVRADYTFQNFAVSESNRLAFVSSNTVSQNIGKSYNPFFIYGPVGVGKTHLMQAIANSVYEKTPDKKIIYLTSEEFTNEVVEAIRSNNTANMKRKFRSATLLLIDDIQFIEGKERVQEELFHTFNILIDNGSQICLSSDRPAYEIKKLEKRLSSRFSGGLTVDIGPPDFELKTAILLIKAKKYGIELPIALAKIIAGQATDTRSLEGLLLRIITQAATEGEEISENLVEKAFGSAKEEARAHLHADDVIKSVCQFYNIKPTQIKGPKRDTFLVRARQIAMYLLKHELSLTYVEIGNMLGGRDHTTIIHGVEKVEAQRLVIPTISSDIVGITKQLRG